MNKKLMYIFAIFIVAAITCISQPKKTTLRDKAMVNYAFDYLGARITYKQFFDNLQIEHNFPHRIFQDKFVLFFLRIQGFGNN